jgi:hypothetical protein
MDLPLWAVLILMCVAYFWGLKVGEYASTVVSDMVSEIESAKRRERWREATKREEQ